MVQTQLGVTLSTTMSCVPMFAMRNVVGWTVPGPTAPKSSRAGEILMNPPGTIMSSEPLARDWDGGGEAVLVFETGSWGVTAVGGVGESPHPMGSTARPKIPPSDRVSADMKVRWDFICTV